MLLPVHHYRQQCIACWGRGCPMLHPTAYTHPQHLHHLSSAQAYRRVNMHAFDMQGAQHDLCNNKFKCSFCLYVRMRKGHHDQHPKHLTNQGKLLCLHILMGLCRHNSCCYHLTFAASLRFHSLQRLSSMLIASLGRCACHRTALGIPLPAFSSAVFSS